MEKLVQGVHDFHRNIFSSQKELFTRLSTKQAPQTLFITCSDSRIDPCLFTQTQPGDLFILRNAGNLIPAYTGYVGSEAATIEFAVNGLRVIDIIICGHSNCGAMEALVSDDEMNELPCMKNWLTHASSTKQIILDRYQHLEGENLITAAAEENVLQQIKNLRTHPCVEEALEEDRLNLHAWIFDIGEGQVYAYCPEKKQFISLLDH
ncbi:MAG: carbonate dehydratase [Waddliaceae bacterium]|nr:carbonate dehydratase [Waddliaceae bacterium]